MKKYFIVGLFCIMVCCLLSACGSCGEDISVSSVSFNESSVELYVGDEYYLEYTISPEDAANVNVTFYSSDENVITVNGEGTVCAISYGEASVIVLTEDGNYIDVCNITVKENEETKNTDESESGDGASDKQLDSDDGETDGGSQSEGDGGEDNGGEQDGNDDAPTIEIYSVSFIADGNIVAICEFTEDNLTIDEPDVPEKAGYTGKWEDYALSLQNITVYAVYTPIDYTATFMVNGVVYYKTTFTVEDTEITEPNVFPFAGYDGVWESYSLGCEDITIKAVYTPIEYKVTYENTKGAENPNSDSYSVENRIVLKDLSLTGYEFNGWYLNGEKVNSLNNQYSDLTLTAQWSLIEYTIIFTDENANDVIETVKYTVEDTEFKIPDVPEKDGSIGTWTYFELTNNETKIYVHAVYTQIE